MIRCDSKDGQLRDLIQNLRNFEKNEEVVQLYKHQIKFITDPAIRSTISPQLEELLKDIETKIRAVLVDDEGYAQDGLWDHMRANAFWVRKVSVGKATLYTNSIAIQFECK